MKAKNWAFAAGIVALTVVFRCPLEGEERLSKDGGSARIVASPTQWTLIGPRPIKSASAGNLFSGRARELAVDPRNGNVVYLGAASGGVWKTTDGGANWTPLTDTQPSLAVGSLALDPSNPNTIYVGTGEGLPPIAYPGAGILKSTDGGVTWKHLPGPFVGPFNATTGGAVIPSLAVHPTNGFILLAGVEGGGNLESGVYRSSDGGVSWTNVLPGAFGTEVLFDPTDGNIAYATLGTSSGSAANGVYKSVDGGLTWNRLLGAGTNVLPSANLGWMEMAIAPSRPATLYLGISNAGANSKTLLGFYKTVDGGASWTQLSNTPDYCDPQCSYDNVIRVHPTNPDVIFVGGSAGNEFKSGKILIRSLDGGASWTEIGVPPVGTPGLHGDMHAIAFAPGAAKLYVGNDGGVWSTTSVTSPTVNWTNLNATLAITQFYSGLSIDPSNVNVGFGGSQDNGTSRYSGSLTWDKVNCGDGAQTAIDFLVPSTVYVICFDPDGIDIEKSTSGGAYNSWSSAANGFNVSDRHARVAPFTMDPSNPQRLYIGTFRVFQTRDGAGSWTAISPDLAGANASLTAIAVAPSDSNTLYAGASNGRVQLTTTAGAGAGATWTDRTTGLPRRGVTQIAVDATSAATAYVTVSGFSGFSGDAQGHVFKTSNGGLNWTDISGNLPNVPVNDIVIDPDLPGTLYVATDIGVFATASGGETWLVLGSALPHVPVSSIKLHRPTRTLRAGTYGRSMWDLQVPLSSLALTSQPLPTLNAGGIANAASSTNQVAPGSIVSVYGSNLASSGLLADAVPLPTTLNGVSLRFNGNVAGPAFFAGPNQTNVQVPWELSGQTQATLSATVGGTTSNVVPVNLASFAPGIFTINQQGSGQGAILIAATGEFAALSGSIPGAASRPANRGEAITIYCTGLGAVTNRPATGAAALANPLSRTSSNPTVTIGGVPATVSFSGLAPGFVGLYQVNAQVPANAPVSDTATVVLSIGGATSNAVTIAVR